ATNGSSSWVNATAPAEAAVAFRKSRRVSPLVTFRLPFKRRDHRSNSGCLEEQRMLTGGGPSVEPQGSRSPRLGAASGRQRVRVDLDVVERAGEGPAAHVVADLQRADRIGFDRVGAREDWHL